MTVFYNTFIVYMIIFFYNQYATKYTVCFIEQTPRTADNLYLTTTNRSIASKLDIWYSAVSCVLLKEFVYSIIRHWKTNSEVCTHIVLQWHGCIEDLNVKRTEIRTKDDADQTISIADHVTRRNILTSHIGGGLACKVDNHGSTRGSVGSRLDNKFIRVYWINLHVHTKDPPCKNILGNTSVTL